MVARCASGTGRGVDGCRLVDRFPGISASHVLDEGVNPPQAVPFLVSPAVTEQASSSRRQNGATRVRKSERNVIQKTTDAIW